VLAVFEDHVDGTVLEEGLNMADHIRVLELGAKTHLADGRLRNANIECFILSFGLESRMSSSISVSSSKVCGHTS
jgi:hypothetical protein